MHPVNPVAVGLVGAGPWAGMMHAPVLAAGPETRLAGIWARRHDAAEALARRHGTEAVASFEALLERSEALAFAVPPDVQADFAIRAARAGKHLLLEKPLALDLAAAQRLVAEVDRAGVVTQMVLSYRYRSETIAFLERARTFEATGGRLAFLSRGLIDGPFATPWRREHGALLDLGPHALDLLDAALGPIVSIDGRGDPRDWFALTCRHAGGAISQASLSGTVAVAETLWRCELYGPAGTLAIDLRAGEPDRHWATVRREFAVAVRAGQPHALDVHRGAFLQELIARAAASAARADASDGAPAPPDRADRT